MRQGTVDAKEARPEDPLVEPDTPESSVRADKWLWAVRVFKTRNAAADACRLHQVTVNEQPIKPSRSVKINDLIAIQVGPIERQLRVTGLIERRIGAKRVDEFLTDETPEEAWEKLKEARAQTRQNKVYRGEEGGRPTKRDRRQMEAFETQD